MLMMEKIHDVQQKRTRWWLLLWSMVCGAAILLICSKSSPLYPMNDWVDVQCFFTVGRSIVRGKMPYLDLYEQKGPVLYLFFALGALLSGDSFGGVFLLEVVCFGLFLYESVRIVAIWIKKVPWVLFLLPPVLALGIGISPAFSHGTSAEELFLPAMALFLRLGLTALEEDRPLSRREAFLCGVLGGLALWVKYTFCGIFVGGALGLLVWYLATKKGSHLPGALFYAVLGVAAVTAPILLWFWLRGALPSLWEAYFVNNLTAYASGGSPRHDPPLAALANNWMWSLPGAAGCLCLLLQGRRRWGQGLFAAYAAAALGLFTYANGRTYPYYALILSAFCSLGWAAALWPVEKLVTRESSLRLAPVAVAALLLLGGCGAAAYGLSGNVYLMQYEREDMPQYRFAAILQQEEDPTLLNLGFLDGGFYFASGVEPSERFFCTFNLSLQAQDKEHAAAIKGGDVQFVVVRGKKSPGKNYVAVDQCAFPFEGRKWTYTLYQRIDP